MQHIWAKHCFIRQNKCLDFISATDKLEREERSAGKEKDSTRDKFEGSHMLLINSLKVEKYRENCLFRRLRVTNMLC